MTIFVLVPMVEGAVQDVIAFLSEESAQAWEQK